jgi:type IV secretion system protein VirD4
MRQLAKNPKEQASVFSTVFAKLQLFDDPLIANATSDCDFSLSDFVDSATPISLYLTVPYSDVDRIAPVFRLLITFILKQFSDGETRHGSVRLKNHLLFLLDEFPVLGCFPFMEQVMGVLRGYGINFLIVCQALSQLVKLYGPNHSFLDHCTVQALFAPGKLQDARDFSDAIGTQTVMQERISRGGRRFSVSMGNLNFSDSDLGTKLINPDELMKLPGNECLVMAHGMPPYIGKKIAYYQDKRFSWKERFKAPNTLKEMRDEVRLLPSNKKKVFSDGVIETTEAGSEIGMFDDIAERMLEAAANPASENKSAGQAARGDAKPRETVFAYEDEITDSF